MKKQPSPTISSPMPWHVALKLLRNRVFKIRTPLGHGTGFHIGNFGLNNKLCAVATALHVVESAIDWTDPIKLIHEVSGKEILLQRDKERPIFTFPKSDIAIIVFITPDDLSLPAEEIEYLKSDISLFSGVDIGWCGFPAVSNGNLSFFHGYISCYLPGTGYLADGVAINGVSGGPVFFIDQETNRPVILGVISAYIPNRSTQDTLPGVSMVSSIPPKYEEKITSLRNLARTIEEVKKERKMSKRQVSESA